MCASEGECGIPRHAKVSILGPVNFGVMYYRQSEFLFRWTESRGIPCEGVSRVIRECV